MSQSPVGFVCLNQDGSAKRVEKKSEIQHPASLAAIIDSGLHSSHG